MFPVKGVTSYFVRAVTKTYVSFWKGIFPLKAILTYYKTSLTNCIVPVRKSVFLPVFVPREQLKKARVAIDFADQLHDLLLVYLCPWEFRSTLMYLIVSERGGEGGSKKWRGEGGQENHSNFINCEGLLSYDSQMLLGIIFP